MRIQNHQSPFWCPYMSIKVAHGFVFLLVTSSHTQRHTPKPVIPYSHISQNGEDTGPRWQTSYIHHSRFSGLRQQQQLTELTNPIVSRVQQGQFISAPPGISRAAMLGLSHCFQGDSLTGWQLVQPPWAPSTGQLGLPLNMVAGFQDQASSRDRKQKLPVS